MRIKFRKGGQRKFFDLVREKMLVRSLKDLIQFGIEVNESTLRNYYFEERCLPESLFDDLCLLAGIDKSVLNFEILENNWGQKKGGYTSKRLKRKS